MHAPSERSMQGGKVTDWYLNYDTCLQYVKIPIFK